MVILFFLCLLAMAFALSACRAASMADLQMEEAFAEWVRTHPERESTNDQ